MKQRTQIRHFQDKELESIEETQKQQYKEFSDAWDEYMADYEATAYLSLEKLKERQMKEYQEFQEKCGSDIKKKMKFSKDLLELRHKEEKLIKLHKFDEAEMIKEKADKLEEKERVTLEKKIKQYINK